jgi:hypothetical protein
MAASGRWWAAAAAVWTVSSMVVAVAGAPEVWPLPADLVKQMARGINLGNTLDAKYEGALAPPAEEWLFDDYVEKGFKTVRIPVTWGNHTAEFPPWVDRPLSRLSAPSPPRRCTWESSASEHPQWVAQRVASSPQQDPPVELELPCLTATLKNTIPLVRPCAMGCGVAGWR